MRSFARPRRAALRTACLAPIALLAGAAQGVTFETDDPDLKLRWDTTVGYSLGMRIAKPSATLSEGRGAINNNDGDLNFAKRKRPITSRFDLFTEADVVWRGFGARVSAAAWYDAAYNGGTSNDARLAVYPVPPAPAPFGPFNPANTLNSGEPGEFPKATRDLHGRKAELLDAFVFGKIDLGGSALNLRLGKHALLWGESLFFGFNGIAAGMAPVDIIKAQSSPNAQVKEIVRPVGQLSGQWQATSALSLGAYVQYDWEKNRLPASGSYYSANDTIDVGGERLYLPQPVTTPAGPAIVYIAAPRGRDRAAPDSGQFGLQARYKLDAIETDLGFYAIQYHAKTPVAYLDIPPTPTALPVYRLVYPEDIRSVGASFNTSFGFVNLAGEASVRTNAPLTRGLVPTTGGPGPFDASGNPAYPVGRTGHVNLSTIVSVPSYGPVRESTLVAELAWNRVLSCRLNCFNTPPGPGNPFGYNPRDANAERDAWGWRVVYTPVFRQALTGVDLSVPLGVSYSPHGKSGAVGPVFVDRGGDVSLGLVANVRESFTLAMNYTHYYGPARVQVDGSGFFQFGQTLKDRNNLTLSARTSF